MVARAVPVDPCAGCLLPRREMVRGPDAKMAVSGRAQVCHALGGGARAKGGTHSAVWGTGRVNFSVVRSRGN